MMKRGDRILVTENLSVGYINHGRAAPVMEHLNLTARRGELIALIGRNGSGKSTLLRTLVSLQPLLAGNIMIKNKPVAAIDSSEMPVLVSFTSTEPFPGHNIRVREVVALGRFPHTNWIGSLTEPDRKAVTEALEVTAMLSLAERNIDNISDGERQRTLIARSLAQDTDLLVKDEPTAFLDLPSRFAIVSLLRKLTREKEKCVIYSTHDLDTAINEADSIWLMSDDAIEQGAPEDLVLNKSLAKAFESPLLSFSQSDGTFSFLRSGAGEIALEASGITRKLTEKALKRCGYRINPDARHKIVVETSGSGIRWCITGGVKEECYPTIFELVNHLPEEPPE
ncbi:MAG TPA: ABC transporter ATP-binding protein [Bacteroidales bacterium]|nr:ABC transporter ATP-binding protein [Bacteroidales bacterium]